MSISDGAPWATDLDSEALEHFNDGHPARCKECDRPALPPGGRRSPLNGLCEQHRAEKVARMTAKRRVKRASESQPDPEPEESPLVAAARRVDQAQADYTAAVKHLQSLLE